MDIQLTAFFMHSVPWTGIQTVTVLKKYPPFHLETSSPQFPASKQFSTVKTVFIVGGLSPPF